MNKNNLIFTSTLLAMCLTVITCTKEPAGPAQDVKIDPVTDIDGNIYQTIKIGNQIWTIENLRTTKYNDGSPIAQITDSAAWFPDTTGAYCFYLNTTNTDMAKKYGALYNWYAVGTNKLAPWGWHVPDTTDWNTLENYLIANGYNYDGTATYCKVAKSMAATTDWQPDSSNGAIGNDLTKNNKSGFSALPGGSRQSGGSFKDFGNWGIWWSSTSQGALWANYRYLAYNRPNLVRTNSIKRNGFSVRLVKD